ncbi:MAG: 3-deoxy-manno-octulosonate cytidylyltransferase (CMP-KDO synthetase) [Oceanospirillaceae bacterium]|jgi:3-deoxy-manno-octulosonate cytidylyltransferase (CMP-KDO synthetase)
MDFTVVIPARYGSTRFPGKPLADIAGKPMIQHVYERSMQSNASKVIIATDDERIEKVARGFGALVCMTRENHPTGTDRLQEVVEYFHLADDEIVVNVQGDEPLIPAIIINQVAENLAQQTQASIATLSEPIRALEQLLNPNSVKVLTDINGLALYFSRAPIPWPRDAFNQLQQPSDIPEGFVWQRHIGIYAYKVALLNKYVTWAPAAVEETECLEQLRAMWYGHRIHVAQAIESPPAGIDTPEDLQRLIASFSAVH